MSNETKYNYLFKVRNNQQGRAFINQLRAFLNSDTYLLRLKGNHQNRKSVGGTSWYTPLESAEEIRIYLIDKTTGHTIGMNQNHHVEWLRSTLEHRSPVHVPVQSDADAKLALIHNIINN